MADHTIDVWKEIVTSLVNKLNGELEHVDDLYVAIEELDSHVKSSADFIAEQDKTIADLLHQLEQREQEIVTLTDDRAKIENDSQNNLFKVLNARIVELAEQLKAAQRPIQWHPASEEPEHGYVLVEKRLSLTNEIDYAVYPAMLPESAIRWCYIDEVK